MNNFILYGYNDSIKCNLDSDQYIINNIEKELKDIEVNSKNGIDTRINNNKCILLYNSCIDFSNIICLTNNNNNNNVINNNIEKGDIITQPWVCNVLDINDGSIVSLLKVPSNYIKDLPINSSIKLVYQYHINNRHWDEISSLKERYQSNKEWPDSVKMKSLIKMLPLLLNQKYLYNNSFICLKIFDIQMVFVLYISDLPIDVNIDIDMNLMINNNIISNIYHCNTIQFTSNIELIPINVSNKSLSIELESNNNEFNLQRMIDINSSNDLMFKEIKLASFHRNNFIYLTNICNRILLNNSNNDYWFGARSILISSPQGSGKSFLLDSINKYAHQLNIKIKHDNIHTPSIHIINLIGTDIKSNNNNSNNTSNSCRSSNGNEIGLDTNKIDIDNELLINENINILLNSLENKNNSSSKVNINKLNKNDSILILIDDLDRILTAYNVDNEDSSENFMSIATCLNYLLKLISYSNYNKNKREIIIIGTTRIQEKFLLRANTGSPEFEKILKIPRLTDLDRKEIIFDLLLLINEFELETLELIENNNNNNNNISLWSDRISKLTNGYLPGDLTNIVKRLIGIQRGYNKPLPVINQTLTRNNSDILSKPILLWSNILIAISNIPPKQLQNLKLISSVGNNDISSSSSKALSWYDFAGYNCIKNKIYRLLNRQISETNNNKNKNILFQSNMIPRGIILHGPSGCGKSYLAKIISNEARMNFVSVRSTELLSKYFGETEELIRNLFQQARSASPCVLFFDEFDAIACKRDSSGDNSLYTRILSTFLNEMDGITSSSDTDADSGGVLVLAACTDVNILDEALLRPGRLQHHIELYRPLLEDIIDIFNLQLNKMPHENDINSIEICNILMSSNPTASDVNSLCKNALLIAIEESINNSNNSNNSNNIVRLVNSDHFKKALENKGLVNQEEEEVIHKKESKSVHVFDTPFVFTATNFAIGNR